MALGTVLVLLLAAGEEPVGLGSRPMVQVEQREAVRLRGGIHFAVAGGFSGFAPAIGPGFSAELGTTWADRFSLCARATVGSILVLSTFMAGVAFDVALNDRFSVGVAPSIALLGGVIFITDMPGSVAAYLPVRVSFAPFGRQEHDVARKGLALFLEAGPGYGLIMSPGFVRPPPPRPPPLSFTAAVGVGYAVW